MGEQVVKEKAQPDVRQQMFIPRCTSLSLRFVAARVVKWKGFIIYSGEAKAPANPRIFLKKDQAN